MSAEEGPRYFRAISHFVDTTQCRGHAASDESCQRNDFIFNLLSLFIQIRIWNVLRKKNSGVKTEFLNALCQFQVI